MSNIQKMKEAMAPMYDEGATNDTIAQNLSIQFQIPIETAKAFVKQTIKDDYFGIANE